MLKIRMVVTSIKMAIIKIKILQKTENDKCWCRCGEIGTLMVGL